VVIKSYIFWDCHLLSSWLLLFFDPEDGGNIFLQNFGIFSTGYMALYPRRQNSSMQTLDGNRERKRKFEKLT
jgi:hypothetical protein